MTGRTSIFLSIFISAFLFGSCSSVPKGHAVNTNLTVPDYSQMIYWAALPETKDSADAVPVSQWRDEQKKAQADVFFIHPTSYVGKKGQHDWNADVLDASVNTSVEKFPIRYQASIFNGAGRVYAPRYRQAHLHCFYTDRTTEARMALGMAYEDVRNAFLYYMKHYNHGRPFIIAGHSQGSYHALLLLQEFIDGKNLQEQLIAAYIPGWPVSVDDFKEIKPCETPTQTGCVCSWRTTREGYIPDELHFPGKNILVTNPVTWKRDTIASVKEMQEGAILRDFNKLVKGLVTARIYKDLLWVNKPRFPGSVLLMKKNYHIADYNFFYADVRKNAQDRVQAYLNKL